MGGEFRLSSRWTRGIVVIFLVAVGSAGGSLFDGLGITSDQNQVADNTIGVGNTGAGLDASASLAASKSVDLNTNLEQPNLILFNKLDKDKPQPPTFGVAPQAVPPPPLGMPAPPPPPPPHRGPPQRYHGGKPCKRDVNGQPQPADVIVDPNAPVLPPPATDAEKDDDNDNDNNNRRAVESADIDKVAQEFAKFIETNKVKMTKEDQDLIKQFKELQQQKLANQTGGQKHARSVGSQEQPEQHPAVNATETVHNQVNRVPPMQMGSDMHSEMGSGMMGSDSGSMMGGSSSGMPSDHMGGSMQPGMMSGDDMPSGMPGSNMGNMGHGMMGGDMGMGMGHDMHMRSAPAPAPGANPVPNATELQHNQTKRNPPMMPMGSGHGMGSGMGGGMMGDSGMGMNSAPAPSMGGAMPMQPGMSMMGSNIGVGMGMGGGMGGMGMGGGMGGPMMGGGMHMRSAPGPDAQVAANATGNHTLHARAAPEQQQQPGQHPAVNVTETVHNQVKRVPPMPMGSEMHSGMGGGMMGGSGMGMNSAPAPPMGGAMPMQPGMNTMGNNMGGGMGSMGMGGGMGGQMMGGGMGGQMMGGGMGGPMMAGGMGGPMMGSGMHMRSAPGQDAQVAANATGNHTLHARAAPDQKQQQEQQLPAGHNATDGHDHQTRSIFDAASPSPVPAPNATDATVHQQHARAVPEQQPGAPVPAPTPNATDLHQQHARSAPVAPGSPHNATNSSNRVPESEEDRERRAISPKFGGMMDQVMGYFQ